MSGWFAHIFDQNGPIPFCTDRFRQFLDVCWPHMDFFTLSTYAGMYDDSCPLKDALWPWFASVVTTDAWFGYGPGSYSHRVYRYHAAEGAKETLLSAWNADSWFEDLCLFSGGKLFFGSISHEHEFFLWPLDADMRRFVEAENSGVCQRLDEWSRHDLSEYDWGNPGGPIHVGTSVQAAVLQCLFVEELSAFYTQLLGWTAAEQDGKRAVIEPPDTGVRLIIEYADDYIPPMYPSMPGKQQMMLCLEFGVQRDCFHETIGEAVVLGAEIVDEREGETTLLDPAGHPFKICISEQHP